MDFKTAVILTPDMQTNKLAGEISAEIMEKYEPQLLKAITQREYSFAPQTDRVKIYNIALENSKPDGGQIMNAIHYNRRKAIIEECAEKYLKENSVFILDGFINFRLDEYKKELRGIVYSAGEEYAAMKEYEEFLDMLRFFVSVQSPKEDTVHIINRNGKICVLNKRKKDITDIYVNEFSETEENLTNEDAVLSALISIAPLHIIIHDEFENDQIYKTIKEIFPHVTFENSQ
ncbi:MAG: putative sporulation protein YtxC [Clostridia bacterium]|nr:putative sporulation protein YtxC [Clostridia bacterium]